MKRKFCHSIPEEKEHWSRPPKVDEKGNIRVIRGKKVCHKYYECECGMRYTPSQVEAWGYEI